MILKRYQLDEFAIFLDAQAMYTVRHPHRKPREALPLEEE